MSKSLGNVIDPLDSLAEYGADALRFTLATGTTPGQVSACSVHAAPNPFYILLVVNSCSCQLPGCELVNGEAEC